jgi:hypothetical protein
MQQVTVNLFADMGIQPATLQAGLVAASPSTDVTAPSSTITFPTSGTTVTRNSTITVTGTAIDAGGKVGGVEVSIDGGTSWHPAAGLESWSYQWMPRATGPATIRSRAVDDSGNRETPGAGVPVTVVAAVFSGSIWDNAVVPSTTTSSDRNPVALGLKFRSDFDGSVTGIRFYKGPANVAPHVGSLWNASGSLLASVSFTNETASGWQQALLPTPVPITAGALYVASYHTTAGRYAADPGFFETSEIVSGPLHALKDGVAGGNGVFAYGTSTVFPNDSFNATNYWVDVAIAVGPTAFSGSIWNNATTPSVTAWNDSNAVTLGMKFRSDNNGFVTGIRFYKGAENVPPHVGNLWTASGTLLASVIVANETASGWQQASFATPVPISAGTTYVVSYHTTVGHYAADSGYFAGSETVNGPLHGLEDDAAGGNGVFSYGPNSTFPESNFGAANYWVDIIFSDSPD